MKQRFFTLLFALLVTAHALGQPVDPDDLDEDGMSDALERELIDRHRPWLYYDSTESSWPSSLRWFVERSNLHFCADSNVVLQRSQLASDPWLALRGHVVTDNGFGCEVPATNAWGGPGLWSTSQINPGKTRFALDLLDSARGGMGPLPVGMFAHVVRVRGPITSSCGIVVEDGHTNILVQYWQFFPMNYGGAFCSDHEGDWLRLDVYLESAAPHQLRVILYDPHGSSVGDRCLWGAGLPADGIPRCYIESGSHEWWPSSEWHPTEQCNVHDGDRTPRIRADNIINLGERWAPLCSWDESPDIEASLALFFNGGWGQEGENPGGPATQSAARFPAPLTCRVKYVNSSFSRATRISTLRSAGFVSPEFALGSRYFPAENLNAIAGPTQDGGVADGGTVLVFPGSYPRSVVLDRPMLVTAPVGSVVLGAP